MAKEEPSWQAAQQPSKNRKKWADMAAEPPDKPKDYHQKDGECEEEWWEKDRKTTGKSWDAWWEEKEDQWQTWAKKKNWHDDDDEEESCASQATQKKCGSHKEKNKRRWLMNQCKDEDETEKEKIRLGALGASRLNRLMTRQNDRAMQLEAAKVAQAAAQNAASAAQAAQYTAQQWQALQEAQAYQQHASYQQGLWRHQGYGHYHAANAAHYHQYQWQHQGLPFWSVQLCLVHL